MLLWLFLPFKELLLSPKHPPSALPSWLQTAVVHICLACRFWMLLPVFSRSGNRATTNVMTVFLVKTWKVVLITPWSKALPCHAEPWLTMCFSNCDVLPCFWAVSPQTVALLISRNSLPGKNKKIIRKETLWTHLICVVLRKPSDLCGKS